ncbi:MAG: hypothetical protein KKA10_02080 [Euryarchaeota archaeon]|nr:hypothetical protein [Euryarchaeota archaeon]MCG2737073.1 hypothetical protein [Candidatus Methanoperedenaceae archaeon]
MRFTFKRQISVLTVLFYFISLVFAQTDLTVSDEKNTQNNSINTKNLSNQTYNIRVALDHIFISNKNNSLEISEIVIFRNEGQEIYYEKDNHTYFAISTPLDIRDLKTQAMECCLVQEEGIVYMDPMQPIKPWENFEIQISYTIIPQGTEYVFNKSTIYNTTSLSMFVDKKSGMDLEGSYDAITLSGIEYNVVAFNDLKAGETVSIPVKLTKDPGYLYAVIALFFLFSTGLVYLFKGKIKRGRTKEQTLEELELEKRKIFQTIYGFEKHAGPGGSEEYRKLMEEYRNKAIQISFKIDNLKNKGQEN